MKGPQIRDLSDYTPNKSWLGFLRCCVTSNFKSVAQPVFRVWEPGCGCVVTSFPVNQRTVWTETDLTSASSLLQGGLADGWAVISSRQTCHRKHLPITFTETSTSPETLDSLKGRGGGSQKTIGFFLIFCKENQWTVYCSLWFTGMLPNGILVIAEANSVINLETVAKNLFWEYVTCWFPTSFCVKSLKSFNIMGNIFICFLV